MDVLEEHSHLILSAGHVAENLKSRGLKIGSTTGYTRLMLDALLQSAATQGYQPEISLCPDNVGGGRPLPWMCLRIALEFKLSSTASAVKVGDTVSDIEEALNAGMWAVGVAGTDNEIGLSAEDFAALPESERYVRLALARENLKAAGAHYVVDSVAAIEPVVHEIGERLSIGEWP
jgi:phosphonoacetaldehyde hydrolase